MGRLAGFQKEKRKENIKTTDFTDFMDSFLKVDLATSLRIVTEEPSVESAALAAKSKVRFR